jgi:NAD+ synthase (glutamine-hydrolysing)
MRGKQFREELLTADIEIKKTRRRVSQTDKKELHTLMQKGEIIEKIKVSSGAVKGQKPKLKSHKNVWMPALEEVYNALLLGTKDYVQKNGFHHVVIGLSVERGN